MRIAQIIGTLTLSRWHPSLDAACYKLAVPLSLDDLAESSEPVAEPIVVYDELGAGTGQRIAMSEGGEAAQPFYPNLKPVDAYNAALLDTIQLDPKFTT